MAYFKCSSFTVQWILQSGVYNYRLLPAYILLDKIMHAHWDFDAPGAWTMDMKGECILDKHQNWSTSESKVNPRLLIIHDVHKLFYVINKTLHEV